MPRKGYRQSPEHIAKRREHTRTTTIVNGALDFFGLVMSLEPEERHQIVTERMEELEETIAETERLLASGAGRRRSIRNSAVSLDPAVVERFRNALRDDIRRILSQQEETVFDAAHTPYVSETQTRHAPMTGTHRHDHAAHGAGDADDGIHGGDGTHTHENDASHDHPEQHPHGHTHPGRTGQEGEQLSVSGMYGRQMGLLSPIERRRLRDQQLAEHEARRGGS